MTISNTNHKFINSPHSGLVGCQPASNIFPLANEFAKGKMFFGTVGYAAAVSAMMPHLHGRNVWISLRENCHSF